MRRAPWLMLALIGAACGTGESEPPALQLQWSWALEDRCLAQSMPATLSGGDRERFVLGCVMDTRGVSVFLGPPGDASLEAAASSHLVSSDPMARPTLAVSNKRLIFAVGGEASVVDLTTPSSVPRPIALTGDAVPLVSDGRWLLSKVDWSKLELVDLDQPETRYTYESWRHPTKAIAAQGSLLVFTAGPAGERPGWIRVSPSLMAEGLGFTHASRDDLGEVFDVFVEGDEVVLASWTSPSGPGSWVRIMRLALLDGTPQWPPLNTLDLPLVTKGNGHAYLAWGDGGTGFVAQMDWDPDPSATCLWRGPLSVGPCRFRSTSAAFAIREGPGGFRATRVLLPFLEYEPTVFDLSGRPAPALAAHSGRLVILQGPPYRLAQYRFVEPGTPQPPRDPSLSCHGDITLASARQVGAFADLVCHYVSGRLTVAGADLRAVELPALRRAGPLEVKGNPNLESLSFPALESVERLEVSGNPALRSLDLPTLAASHGDLVVRFAPAIESLHLPSLAAVEGTVRIADDRALATLQLEALTRAGDLDLGGDVVLSTLGAPLLRELTAPGSGLWLSGSALVHLSLPALTSCGLLYVVGNPKLEAVEGPTLETVEVLRVSANPSLTGMVLPALTAVVRFLEIEGNPVLPQCKAEALATQLDAPPSEGVVIRENGACPP